MNTRVSILLTAVAGFAGGLLAGLLLAPQAGRATRRRLAESARDSTHWMEEQFHAFEHQLAEVEHQLQEAGTHLTDRVRAATQDAVDQYLPSMPDDETWALGRDDLSRDLRHLPRR